MSLYFHIILREGVSGLGPLLFRMNPRLWRNGAISGTAIYGVKCHRCEWWWDDEASCSHAAAIT